MLLIRHILIYKIVLRFMPAAKSSGHVLLRCALGSSNEQFVFAEDTVFSAPKLRYLNLGVHYTTLHYTVFCWMFGQLITNVKKASFYIGQYPVLETVQSALHFTSLTDLFIQTPSRLLCEASSHMLQLMREGCSFTYPPLSITRY